MPIYVLSDGIPKLVPFSFRETDYSQHQNKLSGYFGDIKHTLDYDYEILKFIEKCKYFMGQIHF